MQVMNQLNYNFLLNFGLKNVHFLLKTFFQGFFKKKR